MSTRVCQQCKNEKDLSEFSYRGQCLSHICKQCTNENNNKITKIICRKCGQEKDVSEFRKNRPHMTDNICVECIAEMRRKATRTCRKCKKEKALNEFDINDNGHFRLLCKQCMIEKNNPKKICKICKKEKLLEDFVKVTSRCRNERRDICKDCARQLAKNHGVTEERKAIVKNAKLKATYGITLEQYNTMIVNQGNRCKICNKSFINEDKILRINIDHDHITGKIRGILCSKCNSILGYASDNITILMNAVKYLEDNKTKKIWRKQLKHTQYKEKI